MAPTQEEERDERADYADRALGLEPIQPGPNSFAMAEIQRHRYMIQANAFYQADWLERENAPPQGATHPAFLQPDLISNLSLAIPRLPPQTQPASQAPAAPPQQHPRDSNITTLSPFINMGARDPPDPNSPELNLGTTPDDTPQPTQRGFIEERAEQRRHQRSGAITERSPVFDPSPSMPNNGFQGAANTPNAAARAMPGASVAAVTPNASAAAASAAVVTTTTQSGSGTNSRPDKSKKQEKKTDETPKKSLFGLFKRSQGPSSRQPAQTPATQTPTSASSGMPPKAKQLLAGSNNTNTAALTRSPSKTRGWFSRRKSDANDLKANDADANPREPPRSQSSFGFRTNNSSASRSDTSSARPPRGTTLNSSGRPIQGTPNMRLSRHSSLKYMDPGVPPTPPSKDTPPDQQVARNIGNQQSAVAKFTNNTPTRATGFASPSQAVGPSRDGIYGQRQNTRLQTAPSMHSMRASVVRPSMAGSTNTNTSSTSNLAAFGERVNALDIHGLTLSPPTQTQPQQQGTADYSPSVYSDEWTDGHNTGANIPSRIDEAEEEQGTPPRATNTVRHSRSLSTMTQDTTATSGTLNVAYPELLNDPSIVRFMNPEATPPSTRNQGHGNVADTPTLNTAFQQVEDALSMNGPQYLPPMREFQDAGSPQTIPAMRDSQTPGSPQTLPTMQDSQTFGSTQPNPMSPSPSLRRRNIRHSFREGSSELDDIEETSDSGTPPPADTPADLPADSPYMHPAFRRQPFRDLSAGYTHPPDIMDRAESVRRRIASGELLPDTFYDPDGKTFKGRGRKQDDGVRKMDKALQPEHDTPATRSKKQTGHGLGKIPNLKPSIGITRRGSLILRRPGPRGLGVTTPGQDTNTDAAHSPEQGRRGASRGLGVATPGQGANTNLPQSPEQDRPCADDRRRGQSPSRIPRPQASARTAGKKPAREGQGQTTQTPRNQQQTRLLDASSFDPRPDSLLDRAREQEQDLRYANELMRNSNTSLDRSLEAARNLHRAMNGNLAMMDRPFDPLDIHEQDAGDPRDNNVDDGDQSRHKRVSTAFAEGWYRRDTQVTDTPTTMQTATSEATTHILTPNVPADFPRPPGGAPVTSRDLERHQRGAVTPDPLQLVERLTSVVSEQGALMAEMRAEIFTLRSERDERRGAQKKKG